MQKVEYVRQDLFGFPSLMSPNLKKSQVFSSSLDGENFFEPKA
jgi:hypothetical protein